MKYVNAEYIKAVMINDRLMQGNAEFNLYAQQVEIQVNAMPSIDVVRCKECKYLAVETDDDGTPWYYCTPNGHEVDETDFCSWGKREENE